MHKKLCSGAGSWFLAFYASLPLPKAAGLDETAGIGPAPAYLWWSPGVARRVDGGWVLQPLALRLEGPWDAEGEVEIFARTVPLGSPGGGVPPSPSWWRIGAAPGSGRTRAVDVAGAAALGVVLWARARAGGADHWAVTRFNLYGFASGPVLRDATETGPPPPPPLFALSSDGEAYWPQTGHRFTLRPEWPGAETLDSLSVRDGEGRELARPRAGAGGGFAYRPPHDRDLDRAGDAAVKPFVFVADAPEGRGTVAYTLAVHRSRRANHRLAPGLAVVAGAMAASIAAVRLRRRADAWKN